MALHAASCWSRPRWRACPPSCSATGTVAGQDGTTFPSLAALPPPLPRPRDPLPRLLSRIPPAAAPSLPPPSAAPTAASPFPANRRAPRLPAAAPTLRRPPTAPAPPPLRRPPACRPLRCPRLLVHGSQGVQAPRSLCSAADALPGTLRWSAVAESSQALPVARVKCWGRAGAGLQLPWAVGSMRGRAGWTWLGWGLDSPINQKASWRGRDWHSWNAKPVGGSGLLGAPVGGLLWAGVLARLWGDSARPQWQVA